MAQQTMMTIPIPKDIEQLAKEVAKQQHRPLAQYVRLLILKDLQAHGKVDVNFNPIPQPEPEPESDGEPAADATAA